MKKRGLTGILVMSLSLIALYAAVLIGGTMALFTDSAKSEGNKISAGKLDVGVYLTSSVDSKIDEATGKIVDGENSLAADVDLKKSDAPVIDVADIIPQSYGTRIFKVTSNDSAAFTYRIKLVRAEGTTAADTALASQIKLTIRGEGGAEIVSFTADACPADYVEIGAMAKKSEAAQTFSVEYEFVDGASNNEAMNGKIAFYIDFAATQAVVK